MKRLIDNGYPYKMLREQYRMYRILAEFSNTHFYDGKLKTNEFRKRKDQWPSGLDMFKNLNSSTLIHIHNGKTGRREYSYYNA